MQEFASESSPRLGLSEGENTDLVNRHARLFNNNLDILWDSCPDRAIRFPLFFDQQGSSISVPLPGKERNAWPVQQVIRHGQPVSRQYTVQIGSSGPAFVFLLRAFPLKGTGSLPLVVEEVRQIQPEEDALGILAKLDAQLDQLIHAMIDRFSAEPVGEPNAPGMGQLRFPNPHLQPCYETRQCLKTACPAYQANSVRCWELNGSNARHGSHGGSGGTESPKRCEKCNVFIQAFQSPDPLSRICERVNRLLHIIQQKNRESLDCYRQVQQAEKLATLGELTMGIAHEVKTPLSVIMGRLDCLRLEMDTLTKIDLAKDIDVIRFHAGRMREMLDEFLMFARPPELNLQSVALHELIQPALNVLEKTLEESRIRVKMALGQPSETLHVDPLQLRQVLLNVIINARDAMPSGGVLTISDGLAGDDGQWVAIHIADTGEGISPVDMDRLFSPFFTTKLQRGGTGLGLVVSRRIMRRHGGDLAFQSQSGKGTICTLQLPRLGATE